MPEPQGTSLAESVGHNRVIVVTGAGGLIGAQIAAVLRRQGDHVVGVDRTAVRDAETAWECLDVTDGSAVGELAARIDAEHGRLDGFVHSAALTGRAVGRNIARQLESIPLDLWDEMMRANVTSALVCVQAFLPLLRRAPNPSIVLIGSIQGLVPTEQTGAYAVSKTALLGLTRQLAAELAADGITVNMLAPGPTLDGDDTDVMTRNRDGEPTPIGRFGSAQEVGAAVAALLDGAFRNVTGAVIPIDGGEHLRPRRGPRRLSPAADPSTTQNTGAKKAP